MSGINAHQTSIVHPRAQLDVGVTVGAYAIVGEFVEIGRDTVIGAYTQISGSERELGASTAGHVRIGAGTIIGDGVVVAGAVDMEPGAVVGNGSVLRGRIKVGAGTQVFDYCVIGNPGQFPGRHEVSGLIDIGSDVVLREFSIVNKPVMTDHTTIRNGCYIMSRAQIDHDCRIGENVKFGTGATLGGSVCIDEFAYLGMNVVVHQGLRVGAHTMIGMNGVVTKNVPPYAVLINNRFARINRHGLRLRGATDADIRAIESAYAVGDPPQVAGNAWTYAIAKFHDEIADGKVYDPTFSERPVASRMSQPTSDYDPL